MGKYLRLIKIISIGFIIVILAGCISILKNGETATPAYLLDYSVMKNVKARHAGVVSAHPLASKVGLYILQQGGNAIDAAIAIQLALAVVYPEAGNLGGGGFMIIHLANGENLAL